MHWYSLIHLIQFTLTADYFSHVCVEVPALEHTDQKFRDNKKGSYTELLGCPAWETAPLFPEQDANRNQYQLKDEQDSEQAERALSSEHPVRCHVQRGKGWQPPESIRENKINQ